MKARREQTKPDVRIVVVPPAYGYFIFYTIAGDESCISRTSGIPLETRPKRVGQRLATTDSQF